VNKERLFIVAHNLLSDNPLGQERGESIDYALNTLPVLFPDDWQNEGERAVRLIARPGWFESESVADFFGIAQDESDGLFYPFFESPWNPEGLEADADRAEVALGILKFIEWKEKSALPVKSDEGRQHPHQPRERNYGAE